MCGVMLWTAGLLYVPRGDEEACGGPREGHTAPEDTPRRLDLHADLLAY
jgi:hypothetical protein